MNFFSVDRSQVDLYKKEDCLDFEDWGIQGLIKNSLCRVDFLESFLKKALLDKELNQKSEEEGEEGQTLEQEQGISGLFNQIQVVFGFLFDRDRKKMNSFSANYSVYCESFYYKFFKKCLYVFGEFFFNQIVGIIESYHSQIECVEK